jgi:hypothetical protein
MEEFFVITCGSLVFFVLVFGFILAMRWMGYRETMALAERGLARPMGGDNKNALRWGIVIAAVGLALCAGLWPLGFIGSGRYPLGLGPWMLFGLIPTFFGLGLVLIYFVTREEKKPEAKPGPTAPAELPKTE